MKRMILASASPRRKKALKKLNIPFLSISNNIDERKEIENLEMIPEDAALYLSRRKAEITSKEFPDDFVLGMDTIVVLNSEIIGKPKDDKDAVTILWKLNGRWHTVITGVTLINKKKDYEDNSISKTEVKFFKHSMDYIKKYVAKGESFDKAGAYAIQSDGKHLIEEIKGDYSNVVGFPEKTVIEMLGKAGVISPIVKETTRTHKHEGKNSR